MKLNRTKLYQMAWEKPMTQLAKEFGLSDVGLAKLCRKYGIPLPERGYWARVDAGYKVPKKALPRKDYDPEIKIQDRVPTTDAELLQKQQKKEKRAVVIAGIGEIIVPTQLNSPHRLTTKTLRYFEDIRRKLVRQSRMKNQNDLDWNDRPPFPEFGRYRCWAEEGFNLTTSLEMLQRGLCFLDTLAKALEHHGFKIHIDVDGDRGKKVVEAVKDNERIRFRLTEGYKQRMLTEPELKLARAENKYVLEYQRKPSGIFTFSMAGREYWLEKKYVDGAKKIEELLPSIIAEFVDLVPRQKQSRMDREKAEAERNERERREREIRWKRQKQLEQYEAAIAEASQLESLERLESYLRRLELQYEIEHGEIVENVADWLNVVRSVARLNNPLRKRLEYLKDLNNHERKRPDWMPE